MVKGHLAGLWAVVLQLVPDGFPENSFNLLLRIRVQPEIRKRKIGLFFNSCVSIHETGKEELAQ
jgi:hypothetical protein